MTHSRYYRAGLCDALLGRPSHNPNGWASIGEYLNGYLDGVGKRRDYGIELQFKQNSLERA